MNNNVSSKSTNGNGNENITNNQNKHEIVWLPQLIIDMFGNYSIITVLVCIIITIPLAICWNSVNYCTTQIESLCSDILTAYSCIFGLVITGFSIILMLNNDTIKLLSEPYKKPKCKFSCLLNTRTNPYDVLCSSFSLCCIFLLVTIIALLLYRNQPNFNIAPNWQLLVIQIFSIISVLLVFDLLFHLYAISTYTNKKHHKIKISKQDKK